MLARMNWKAKIFVSGSRETTNSHKRGNLNAHIGKLTEELRNKNAFTKFLRAKDEDALT